MSLKRNIFLLSLTMQLLVLGLAVVQFYIAQNKQKVSIRESFQQFATNIDSSLSQNFYTIYHNAQAFTKNEAFAKKDAASVNYVLNELVNLYQVYDVIVFVDAAGNFVASSDISPDGKKLSLETMKAHNFTNEDWFKSVKAGKKTEDLDHKIFGTYVSHMAKDEFASKIYGSEKFGQYFVAMVDDGYGSALGYLAVFAGRRWMDQEITNLGELMKAAGLKGYAITVLDDDGSVLAANKDASMTYKLATSGEEVQVQDFFQAHPEKKEVLERLSKHDVKLFSSQEPLYAYKEFEGKKMIRGLQWRALVEVDSSEAFSDLTKAGVFYYSAMLIALIAAMIISTYIGNKISSTLRSIANQVGEQAEQVFTTIGDLAESANSLSDGTAAQAASLQQTSSAVDQISAMVDQNSKACQTSSERSAQSREGIQRANLATEHMVDTMNNIKAANEKIVSEIESNNEEIRSVVKVISEIAQKTKVIHDIVFQTKLLSFNASVEAARAGEHGKGFSVVAQEVGQLAEMSGKAAKEISDMVSKSIGEVESMVERTTSRVNSIIEMGRKQVAEGVDAASENKEILVSVSSLVTEVHDMTESIARASSEQATGINEVSKAISSIDHSTQNNSVIASRTKEATDYLNMQAKALNEAATSLKSIVDGMKGDGAPNSETHSKSSSLVSAESANKHAA